MTRNAACSPVEEFEQRGRLYKGRGPRSKTKHIYARAVPFLRHGSRKRHFTRPSDNGRRRQRRGEEGKGRWCWLSGRATPSVSSSLYWQPAGNPPGNARDEKEQLLHYPKSYFVTARPDIAHRSALRAPIETHYRSEINFPTSVSPWAHSKGSRVRLRTRERCTTVHRRRYKARGCIRRVNVLDDGRYACVSWRR